MESEIETICEFLLNSGSMGAGFTLGREKEHTHCVWQTLTGTLAHCTPSRTCMILPATYQHRQTGLRDDEVLNEPVHPKLLNTSGVCVDCRGRLNHTILSFIHWQAYWRMPALEIEPTSISLLQPPQLTNLSSARRHWVDTPTRFWVWTFLVAQIGKIRQRDGKIRQTIRHLVVLLHFVCVIAPCILCKKYLYPNHDNVKLYHGC